MVQNERTLFELTQLLAHYIVFFSVSVLVSPNLI
jgi:hypothetical protein